MSRRKFWLWSVSWVLLQNLQAHVTTCMRACMQVFEWTSHGAARKDKTDSYIQCALAVKNVELTLQMSSTGSPTLVLSLLKTSACYFSFLSVGNRARIWVKSPEDPPAPNFLFENAGPHGRDVQGVSYTDISGQTPFLGESGPPKYRQGDSEGAQKLFVRGEGACGTFFDEAFQGMSGWRVPVLPVFQLASQMQMSGKKARSQKASNRAKFPY